MSTIPLESHPEHIWGVVTDWDDPYFPDVTALQDVITKIDQIDADAEARIELERQRYLGMAQALPTGQQLAIALVNAHFDGALMVKKAVVAAAKAAVNGVSARIKPVYVANGNCPINQNPTSTVELHDWDFDPDDLPSFDQDLTVTLNLPPVTPIFSLELPMPIKWEHGFTMTARKVGDALNRQPIDHHTTDLFKERVDTTHSFILRYKAAIRLGPFKGTVDHMWVATQVASSQWCT